MKYIFLFINLFSLSCLFLFAGGEIEDTNSDYFSFNNEIKNIYEVPFFFTSGTLDNYKIHSTTLTISVKSPGKINSLIIDASFLQNTIDISRLDYSATGTFIYDSNISDPDNGILVIIDQKDLLEENIDISFIKKPTENILGQFSSYETVCVTTNLNIPTKNVKVKLTPYNTSGVNPFSIEGYDTVSRLDISHEVIISTGGSKTNIYRNQKIYFNSYINKTFYSLLNYEWDFSNQAPTSFLSTPGSITFTNLGSYLVTQTVRGDLGSTTVDTITINISENNAPTIPELFYPLENDVLPTEKSFFCWYPSIDYENDKIFYEVQISEEESFDNILTQLPNKFFILASIFPVLFSFPFLSKKNKKITLPLLIFIISIFLLSGCPIIFESQFNQPPNTITFEYNNLENNKQYYWKVIATDACGYTTESKTIKFLTK